MLTKQQQQATKYHKHLSVTANAGAGKTTVLIRRFLTILLETECSVSQLVAITFTEKAASELRSRISAQIKELISQESGKRRRRLLDIQNQLSSANISTIHAFCAQIVREFPVEANVDAGFTIIEGTDQQILLNESLREEFDRAMTGEDNFSREIVSVAKMLGTITIEQYIRYFLNKRELITRLREDYFKGLENDETILSRWNELIQNYINGSLRGATLRKSFEILRPLLGGKRSAESLLAIGKFLACDNEGMIAGLFSTAIRLLFTQQGDIRKNVLGTVKISGEANAAIHSLFDHFGRIDELIQDPSEARENHRTMLTAIRTLLDLYERVERNYQEKKSLLGQLDFDDLQFIARDLLRNEGIRIKVCDHYRFLMVDEYQDTNYLQYEILRLLVSHFDTGNLFIVGDPKQSIYGFRNAEVELFERSKTDIRSSSGGEDETNILIAESFRHLPSVTDFVNRVFTHTMSSDISRFDVGYDELVCARKGSLEGNVHMLLTPATSSNTDSKSDPFFLEGRMIARHLIGLQQSGHPILSADGVASRPFNFGDAAILLRRRTHLAAIESALAELAIPYSISGGIGYYQTQEVLDFLNYLSFLINPEEDRALVGILRSPLFAITDTELFEISLEHEPDSFWTKTQRHCTRDSCTKRLNQAVGILTSQLPLANRVPIPILLQNIIALTGWAGAVAGSTGRDQRIANVEKLIDLSREFESRGFLSLYDFLERIKTLSVQEEREGQAAIETDTRAVRVMTIHAAKGLEFPVVVIPFLDQPFRYDRPPYLDAETGIAFKVRDAGNFDKEIAPPLFYYMRHQSITRTEAEEKRIFYVATTRARDLLILSGSLAKPLPTSYMRWVFEALGLERESIKPGNLSLPVAPLRRFNPSGDGEIINSRHQLTLEILFPETLEDQSGRSTDRRTPVQRKELLLEQIQGVRRGEFYSASQIKTYKECPVKFYLKYLIGLPERQTPVRFDENEDRDEVTEPDIVGSMTHLILRDVSGDSLDRDHLRKQIEEQVAVTPSLPDDVHASYIRRIEANVTSFIKSGFGKKILSSPEWKTELCLTTAIGEDFLTGTIDRIYRSDSGGWSIVDYKTDNIPFSEIIHRAEGYRPQLSVYALLVNGGFQQDKVVASVVFLNHPEKPVHFHYDKDDLTNLQREVKGIIQEIKSKSFRMNPAACPFCPYFVTGACLAKGLFPSK